MNRTIPIHVLSASGDLGEQVGQGTAISPTLVLVHPPLSYELAELGNRDDSGLAVTNVSAGKASVRRVNVAEGKGEPLVALDLSSAVPADLVHGLPDGKGIDPADALRGHLIGTDPLTRGPHLPPPAPRPPWCAIWPTAWICDDNGTIRNGDESI